MLDGIEFNKAKTRILHSDDLINNVIADVNSLLGYVSLPNAAIDISNKSLRKIV